MVSAFAPPTHTRAIANIAAEIPPRNQNFMIPPGRAWVPLRLQSLLVQDKGQEVAVKIKDLQTRPNDGSATVFPFFSVGWKPNGAKKIVPLRHSRNLSLGSVVVSFGPRLNLLCPTPNPPFMSTMSLATTPWAPLRFAQWMTFLSPSSPENFLPCSAAPARVSPPS